MDEPAPAIDADSDLLPPPIPMLWSDIVEDDRPSADPVPTDSPVQRFATDALGRKYPVDEFGFRIFRKGSRPKGYPPEEWNRLNAAEKRKRKREFESVMSDGAGEAEDTGGSRSSAGPAVPPFPFKVDPVAAVESVECTNQATAYPDPCANQVGDPEASAIWEDLGQVTANIEADIEDFAEFYRFVIISTI